QYERVRHPYGAVTQVSNDEQHVNRPDERCHEAAECNQGTQPGQVVVLAELRLLPLPPGNLFIRAVFLGQNQKWRQHGNALLGHLPCHYPALHAVCATASPTAGRVYWILLLEPGATSRWMCTALIEAPPNGRCVS